MERPLQSSYQPKDYPRVLKRWTRYAAVTLLSELTTTIRVYATAETPDWIEAYVARRAADFSLSKAQAAQLRRELLEQWHEHYTFIVNVATHDLSWNDLERKPSHWHAVLRTNRGLQVDAVEIKSVRRLTEVERSFFPQLDAFYRMYYIRFPRRLEDGRYLVDKGTDQLDLRLAGPLGQANLVWKLR